MCNVALTFYAVYFDIWSSIVTEHVHSCIETVHVKRWDPHHRGSSEPTYES